jgi:hypothetical protein
MYRALTLELPALRHKPVVAGCFQPDDHAFIQLPAKP